VVPFPFLPPYRLREGLGVGHLFLTETPALPANAGLPTPDPSRAREGGRKALPRNPDIPRKRHPPAPEFAVFWLIHALRLLLEQTGNCGMDGGL